MFFSEVYKRQASDSGEYEIKKHHGQFGVVRHIKSLENDDSEIVEDAFTISEMDSDWVVEPCYDNIFKFDRNVFILYKHRKLGAVRCIDRRAKLIAHCQYDKVDTADYVLVFFEPSERLCYFRATQTIRVFSKISFYGPWNRYLFAVDAKFYYIIDCESDMVLWLCSKDDTDLCPWDMFGEEPCLVYMGDVDGLPTFYDCVNCNYIIPGERKKLDFAPNFPNILAPIIVQGKNIVNITEDRKKLNAGNLNECVRCDFSDSKGFDEITVEVKITLKDQFHTEVRCYPVRTFTPDDTVYYDEW